MADYNGLYLWQDVHDTPEQYTKDFTRGGGFSGTAIDPTYLVMRATELWGPIGARWGYEITQEDYIEGEPIIHYPKEEGLMPMIMGHITIHKVRVKLWYPVVVPSGEETTGYIEQFGQTTFIGRTKNGLTTDEEHAKKSVTDALSKCLSLLGFGADVRIGRFEDSDYAQRAPADEPDQTSTSEITADQKRMIADILKQMDRDWERLAGVCSKQLGREIKGMDDLTEEEAVKVIAFLEGKVAK